MSNDTSNNVRYIVIPQSDWDIVWYLYRNDLNTGTYSEVKPPYYYVCNTSNGDVIAAMWMDDDDWAYQHMGCEDMCFATWEDTVAAYPEIRTYLSTDEDGEVVVNERKGLVIL